MIDPRELRIGNLVHAIDRSNEIHLPGTIVWQVVEIKIDGVSVVQSGINPAQVEEWGFIKHSDTSPIELTPDWLDRARFKKASLGNYFIELVNTPYNLLYSPDYKCVFVNTIRIEVQFIHQLQNLYYALTGKELDFKPGTGGI